MGTDDEVYDMDLEPSGQNQAMPELRRRRAKSRPRQKPGSPASDDPYDGKPLRARAAHLARAIAATSDRCGQNLDLECRVHGVTPRGAVKLKVLKVEALSADMLDHWRALCASQGYLAEVTFCTVTSEVNIVCTPRALRKNLCSTLCDTRGRTRVVQLHPLSALFAVVFVANLVRHAAQSLLHG